MEKAFGTDKTNYDLLCSLFISVEIKGNKLFQKLLVVYFLCRVQCMLRQSENQSKLQQRQRYQNAMNRVQ